MNDNTFQQSIFDNKSTPSKIENIMNNVNSIFKEKLVVSLDEKEADIKKKQKQSRYVETDRVINKYKK